MGPVRFDITYKRTNTVPPEAARTNGTATFKGRANDAMFVFYEGKKGEYIRFYLADPESRLALRKTGQIAGNRTPASTDAIRVNHGDFAEFDLRRRLGLSLGGGPIFGTYRIHIEDAGADPSGVGVFVPLQVGGPGGDDWVVEC